MKYLAMLALVLAAAAPIATVYAAKASKALVTIQYTDTVAPAEMQAYKAGIQAYVLCLRQRSVTFNEYSFTQVTGRNTYKISFEREPMTWAERDALGGESRPCKPLFNTRVAPHLKSESGVVLIEEPELSHQRSGGKSHAPPPFLHIVNYTLNPGAAANAAFTEAVKKIAAAAAKTKWPYYWNTAAIAGGGKGAPDYQLAIGGKNWAVVAAEPGPSLWEMVASAYGRTEANAIRSSLDDAIAKISDHFERYDTNLSYIAHRYAASRQP